MKAQWDNYSERYLGLNIREQCLLPLAGIVVFSMTIFTYFVEDTLVETTTKNKEQIQLIATNSATAQKIMKLNNTLVKDPNIAVNKKINEYKDKLLQVDGRLLKLTSDLIDPIEMRHALLELLKVNNGVKLISFTAKPVEPLWLNQAAGNEGESDVIGSDYPAVLGLYRHSIRLTLRGQYFDLRDYLLQLENLSWTFFWHKFNYTLAVHPLSDLEIEIYSLSTNPDFIGV